QRDNKLTVDGIAGQATLSKLKQLIEERRKRIMATPSPWAKESWERMTKVGIVDGTRPRDNMSRQEMAKVVDSLLFNNEIKSWDEDEILEAVENEITDGTNMGGLATREQVVSMLIRSMLTKEDVVKIVENYLEEEKENGEDKLEEETI